MMYILFSLPSCSDIRVRSQMKRLGQFIKYQYKASGFTDLFTVQFHTEDYSAFKDVIQSIGESTSCSSDKIFILAPNIFLCLHKGLFTGQFNTEDYSEFTDVVQSIGGSTSCSSHIIFILAPKIFLCHHNSLFTSLFLLAPFHSNQTNTLE